MAEPLTVTEVVNQIGALLAQHPEVADWPVHILDMEPDSDLADQPWTALVTHVETDRFSDKQPMVLSLLAWREKP